MKIPVIAAVTGALVLATAPATLAFNSTTTTKNTKATKTEATKTGAKKIAVGNRWPAENLSGRIDIVDSSAHLLIVKGDNTIFDFVVSPSTRIVEGDKRLSLANLKDSDQVTIHFVPERKGDVATRIQVD